MKEREIESGISWVGAVDWSRKKFDALISLPEGTSYNAYLVRGSEKVALVDTVDPAFASELLARLDSARIGALDYIVANHAEQDHSGTLPLLLERFPMARVLTTAKARPLLSSLLHVDEARLVSVEDGETVSLGDKSLTFVHFPWVHWPETMLTYVPEARILFSCDLFGSHRATSELREIWTPGLASATRLYFAQIMMPFSKQIAKRLDRVEALDIDLIAPSHGPVHAAPNKVLQSYRDWSGTSVRNKVVIPNISMHGSTRVLVDRLTDALMARNIEVVPVDLEDLDAGRLATALLEAATVVLATPVVLNNIHPNALYAAHLLATLKPAIRLVGVIGSYGWGGKPLEAALESVGGKDIETLPVVSCQGLPTGEVLAAIEDLAASISKKHEAMGCRA